MSLIRFNPIGGSLDSTQSKPEQFSIQNQSGGRSTPQNQSGEPNTPRNKQGGRSTPQSRPEGRSILKEQDILIILEDILNLFLVSALHEYIILSWEPSVAQVTQATSTVYPRLVLNFNFFPL